ncbi:MAG: arylesterase [Pseudomonadota bacterium]
MLVLGDSISAAFGMALEQGWVALLAQRLNADGAERPVINASISGDTSAGGLRRLPALLSEHRPKLLIIELGGNDGLRGYPTGELRKNLTRMADLGREAGAEVLLLPMEIPPNLGARYTRAFRQTFRDAAAASDSRLGPFILQDIATQPELMQEDGIHPSIEAQPMIVDHLQNVVEEMLLTSAES